MPVSLTTIIVLVLSPAAMVAVHMLLTRMWRNRPPQLLAVLAVVFAALPTGIVLQALVWSRIESSERLASVFYCCIVYSGFATFYFHFFNTSETARRIKLLYEIYSGGGLSEHRITELYSARDVIRLRLRRLVETRQLDCVDGHYVIRNRLLYAAARAVGIWQRVLGLPLSHPVEGSGGSRRDAA